MLYKKRNMKISVIIPVFNEEDNIAILHQRLSKTLIDLSSDYELIFVNDGSRDDSLDRVISLSEKDNKVKYLSFSRNFGHQVAVSAGLDFCKGEAIIIIDSDLQDPPELISELYKKYKEGFKVVYAKRKKRKGETWFKKITARAFYRVLTRLTNINIPLDTGDFRLIDRAVAKQLKNMHEREKFLRGQIAWLGFKQTFVEFERDARHKGETGYPLKKMLKFAIDGITAFSDAPLKFATFCGFFVFLFSLIIIAYALFSHFILERTVGGWTSLIISSVFIGGIQLLSLGIIGEYISRIANNVRNRPLYILEETNIMD